MIEKIKHYGMSFVLVFVCAFFISQASNAQPYVCLPTCDVTDSKFITLSGVEVFSLNDATISFGIRSPGENASVELGIFDGDRGGLWDLIIPGADIEITLYADPSNDGTGNVVVGQWLGDTMTDNDWFVINQPNAPGAIAADGDYIYKLTVETWDQIRNLGTTLKLGQMEE